ncbi:MAG TPA: hypothetical protein VMZ73_05700 [Acidimicrobiales bacterium]|nr:hypothetical protein [Acidimicrobiales bacterium]
MPIGKGDPYGEPGGLPEGGVIARTDAEAAAALTAARRDRRPFPALGLLGGDLCRTLGGGAGGDELQGVRFTVDLGEALLDGRLHLFVAHLVARTTWWTRAFVAMNAQYLGDWNLGPRAHPNDGLIDTYDAHLGRNQLLPVRARLHHGAHLPHPGIKERRTAALQVELERPLKVRLDGAGVGKAQVISVRVQPDALTVVI